MLHGDGMTLYRESEKNALGVGGTPGRPQKHDTRDAVSRSSESRSIKHHVLPTSSSSPNLGLRVSSEECAEIKRNAIYHMLRECPGTEYCFVPVIEEAIRTSSQVMMPPCRPNSDSCVQSNVEIKANKKCRKRKNG